MKRLVAVVALVAAGCATVTTPPKLPPPSTAGPDPYIPTVTR